MPNKVQIKFIKDCIDNYEILSSWEYDFINSIAEIPTDKPLSPKQNSVLNRCIKKVNDSGNYSYGDVEDEEDTESDAPQDSWRL